MVTIKQIAEITNISRGTIDRVLNNRGGVSAETEKKIRTAIEVLNYLPNKAGKNLAVRKRKLRFGFILFSPSNYNPFFESVEAGIKEKATELQEFGVSVDIRYTPFNAYSQQLELLDYFANNNYDGIAITALNVTDIVNKINEISEKGIPIVTVNTDIPNSARLAYVGSNYYKCGEVAANVMGLITNGNAKLGIVGGSNDIMCLIERSAGFIDYLSNHYPNIKIIDTMNNNQYDEIENYLITKKMLETHTEIDSIYLAAAGVNGACKAVMEAKRKITVIAYDYVPSTKQFLEENVVSAIIDQEPLYQGKMPLEILFQAATIGTASLKEYYYTDAIIKIRTNL